jgi:hypothetical protein
MRGLIAAVALLGMVNAVQAKEAATLRSDARSSAVPAGQLATNSAATSRDDAERGRQDRRRGADFSAERIVPSICRGC